MDTRFAISTYPPDAAAISKKLDMLIKSPPIYSISREALDRYEKEYFDESCARSKTMISEAKHYIPGGVQHNLAFNHPFPLVMKKAEGAYLYDLDGHRYFDFLQAGGPTVLGSNPPLSVREKVIEILQDGGPSTGLFHEYEYKLAKKICDSIPSVEMFRMFNSGSEACMAAIRVARLATGKKNIIKMGGGAYHGWSDQLAYGIRLPGTRGGIQAHGVPSYLFKHTQEFFPPNRLDALERTLRLNKLRGGGTAAVFIEPVGPESGTRPLDRNFNQEVEKLCRTYHALLIFDEVVTGFRIGMAGGAQGYFGVSPDLTVFGKVIAGGYPGAGGGLGGKQDYMKYLAAGIQTGDKIHKALVGGTMAATPPLSCVAGYYTLEEIDKTDACQSAGLMGDRLTKGLQALIERHSLPFVAFNQGSICHLETVGTMHFSVNWKKPWTIPHVIAETSKRKKEMEYMGAAYMAEGVVTLAGSRLYTSAAYTEEMIDESLKAFDRVFSQIECIKD